MGEKRKRLLHEISENQASREPPTAAILISSDEDEPHSKHTAKRRTLLPVQISSSVWEYGSKNLSRPDKQYVSQLSGTFEAPTERKNHKHHRQFLGDPDLNLDTYLLAAQEGFSPEEHIGKKSGKATKKDTPATEPELCEEQRNLVDLILSGRNVFYTGSAGCGKSTVLKQFVKELKARGKTVNIIAPTGRAALDINGSTFWTYAGWTPLHMKRSLKELKNAAHGKWVKERFRATDVLVIDEISMVENHHLERLNEVMKEGRGKPAQAFGGVQMVVTGDFCQLPPVKPFAYCLYCGRELIKRMDGTVHKCPRHGEFLDHDKWAFRSSAWKEANFTHVCLRTIHRQKDRKFIHVLEKCRMGKVFTDQDTNTLLNHKTNFKNAVKLFSTREEVRRVNQSEFDKLKAEKRVFSSEDVFKPSVQCDPFTATKFNKRNEDGSLYELRDHRFDSVIELKEGMQVVLLVNLDLGAGLVNGSTGEIIGWETFEKEKLPKAKGSLSNKERTDHESRMPASAPVLSGDYCEHREENIKAFIQKAGRKEWPIVRFDNGLTKTIIADCTVNEIGEKSPWSILSRTQIPLLAAWAMSIHKSQGMSLNKVTVDLSRSFEEGQMYVALSRARSLNGLRVDNLGKWMPKGNLQVMQFLREKFQIE